MKTQEMLVAGREVVVDCFSVSNSVLPESYRRKKNFRSLSSVVAQLERKVSKGENDPRDISVKFDNGRNITEGTKARLAAIENYRKQIEQNGENEIDIVYDVNEHKLYDKMITFAKSCPQIIESLIEDTK